MSEKVRGRKGKGARSARLPTGDGISIRGKKACVFLFLLYFDFIRCAIGGGGKGIVYHSHARRVCVRRFRPSIQPAFCDDLGQRI